MPRSRSAIWRSKNLEHCRAYERTWRKKHRKERRSYFSQLNQSNKDRCYEAYGGYRCACKGCDVTEPMFLTLDHVKGHGNHHRRAVGLGGGVLYRWIIKHNFPKKMFRVLCQNCNSGRHRNGGVCPHLNRNT